jgi:subtilisin family serine protease
VTVGVVDSGIDGTHPDLNLVGGLSWVAPSAKVAGDVADANVDRYGHGTHVAGIIGARNNGECLSWWSPPTAADASAASACCERFALLKLL